MNQIVFTPQEFIETILYICGAIVSVSAASIVVMNIIRRMKQPNILQNERLEAIENKLKLHEMYLSNDKEQLEDLKLATKVQIKATQALLSHGIDGDAVNEMKMAKQAISDYIDGKVFL